MPRRSSAAVALESFTASTGRITPPSDLPDAERSVFEMIVRSLPPEHFEPCDAILLAAFARCVVLEQNAGKALTANPDDASALARHATAIRSMGALCLRLRLSPQSRAPHHRRVNGRQPSAYETMGLMR